MTKSSWCRRSDYESADSDHPLRLDELVEVLEAKLAVAVRVCLLDHRFDLLVRDRLAEVVHDLSWI